MHVSIITDCGDENAVARLSARTASLFGGSVHVTRLAQDFASARPDIEAAGHLVDVLDAYGDREGVVLVNVAPRGGEASRHENGTPFGYFRYRRALVVTTLDGRVLSLARSLGLLEGVGVRAFSIPDALASLPDGVRPDPRESDRIARTQFRSYEFQPRVARWLADGIDVASGPFDPSAVPELAPCVWHVDNFGNAKTSVPYDPRDDLPERFVSGGVDLPLFPRLRDVPDGTVAAVIGSSGIGSARFVELVVQRGSAAELLGLSSGDEL